jgi:hypothetical protein
MTSRNTSSIFVMSFLPAIHISILTLNCVRLKISESPQLQKLTVLTSDREGPPLKYPRYENTSAYELNWV